jgi:hypothetical protein
MHKPERIHRRARCHRVCMVFVPTDSVNVLAHADHPTLISVARRTYAWAAIRERR